MLESNQRVINDFAVRILKLVGKWRIELPISLCNSDAKTISRHAYKFVPDYTAPGNRYPILSFCPVAALSADNTFLTPTGPTLLIVRHAILSTHVPWDGLLPCEA